MSHVGIYVGDGQVVDAGNEQTGASHRGLGRLQLRPPDRLTKDPILLSTRTLVASL